MIPLFSLPHHQQLKKYGEFGIEANDELYLLLYDPTKLYEFFGYRSTLAALPDEFIWEHYQKPSAPKSPACIQPILMTFLYRYSARFREEYGEEYRTLIGKCRLDKIDNSDACIRCMHHPIHYYAPEAE